MNKIAKYVVASSLFLVAPASQALKSYTPMQGKYQWTLGVDTYKFFSNVAYDYQTVTYGDKTGYAVYLGYRTMGIYGFELGYSWTDRKPNGFAAVPGTQAFGSVSAINAYYQGKISFRDTYFDFYAHIPLAKYVEAKMGIGLGYGRVKMKWYTNGVTPPTDPLGQAVFAMQGGTGAMLRLNLGLQALVTKRIGVRALVGYMTSSNVKVDNINPGVNTNVFGNAFTVTVGVYWNFLGLPEAYVPSG